MGDKLKKEGYQLSKEDVIREKMYQLGYEDGKKNKKYGSSINDKSYEEYLSGLGMEQITLF